jgi:hypothetical protein
MAEEIKRKAKRTRKANMKAYITKKQFEETLERVFTTPVPCKPLEHAQEATQTSESHPSDDCSGKRKNRGKTVGKEG